MIGHLGLGHETSLQHSADWAQWMCCAVKCLQARASEASASAAAGSTFMRSAAAEGKASSYERRLAAADDVVEQLRGGIGSLFETAVSCRLTGKLLDNMAAAVAAATDYDVTASRRCIAANNVAAVYTRD